jgi:hypothetical protein
MCDQLFSIHGLIIHENAHKVKPLAGLLVKLFVCYATLAAMVGVPQLAVRKLVLGGIKVTKVVGAVPVMVVLGLVVAVPPVMLELTPGPDDPSSTQVVTKVNTVVLVAVAVVRMNSGEYGDTVLFNWNMVVGDPVKLYQPVVVAKVVCVPPDPLRRVVPV